LARLCIDLLAKVSKSRTAPESNSCAISALNLYATKYWRFHIVDLFATRLLRLRDLRLFLSFAECTSR
jgi:hypothetical protein